MRRQGRSEASAADDAASRRAREMEVFLHTHGQRLVGALTLITGSRAAAEDALADALVKAWDRRDQPVDNLAAWLTVVATNQARSTWRRRQAEQRALDRAGGRAGPLHTDAAEPHDDALTSALRHLPEREREVAVLHYVMDQSVQDVAAALGVAEGTVKTLLYRARQHLAERLAESPAGDAGGDQS